MKPKIKYITGNNNLKIPSREEFYKRFSGVIYPSDYDYPTSLTSTASRIASNLKFDESCKRNSELRKNNTQNITN